MIHDPDNPHCACTKCLPVHWRFGPGINVPDPLAGTPHKREFFEQLAQDFLEDNDLIFDEWRKLPIAEQFALIEDSQVFPLPEDEPEEEDELPEGIDD
ncbi:MAG: hypothetical protein GTN99_09145 [Candidatus Dadabacteria bacterium]|nr:hypothetical protein [Candidatus Dadabacteria bacterium]